MSVKKSARSCFSIGGAQGGKVVEGAPKLLFQVSSLSFSISLHGFKQYSQTTILFFHTSSLPSPLHTITLFIISGTLKQHGPCKPGRLDRWLWWFAIITSVYLIPPFSPRRPPCPALTPSWLSQDQLFDTFREVCISSKAQLEPTRRHHKNRAADPTCVHRFPTHVCKRILPTGYGMFWLHKHTLV